jgi:hypothetical protein
MQGGLNMYLKKNISVLGIIFLVFFSFNRLIAQEVNILTWWGYIDNTSPEIQKINEKCHVTISYDEYYSNNTFVERMHESPDNYDIVIFSKTILNEVQQTISNDASNLYTLTTSYLPQFYQNYLSDGLPQNIVYFSLSLTGFLYNPNVVTINKKDSIQTILDKVQDNLVVIIDDAVEANVLDTKLSQPNIPQKENTAANSSISAWEHFNNVFKNKHVFITNNPDNIITHGDFAVGFLWSGDAIREISEINSQLKFFVHPQLSYISADLLATLNENPLTRCVAGELAGKEFLNTLQEKTYYFSPYSTGTTTHNPQFKKLYNDMYEQIDTLPWLAPISKDKFNDIKQNWEFIKYKEAKYSNG